MVCVMSGVCVLCDEWCMCVVEQRVCLTCQNHTDEIFVHSALYDKYQSGHSSLSLVSVIFLFSISSACAGDL